MNRVTRKGVTYLTTTGEVVDCLFCRINARKEAGTIVYEDDSFVVFKTIQPATHLHLLVTPREHIKNIRSLHGVEGADLVKKMVDVGKVALGEYADDSQFCFHVPPINSVDHLHLHAIASPSTMKMWTAQKYRPNTFFCQSAAAAIHKLSREGNGSGRPPEVEHQNSHSGHHKPHAAGHTASPGRPKSLREAAAEVAAGDNT
jgi:diadenosine tetraphosphate (Ap4A) HIT family hydrolase